MFTFWLFAVYHNCDKPITIKPPDMLLSAAHKLLSTDPSKPAVWGVGLQRLVCGTAGSNTAVVIDACVYEWRVSLCRGLSAGPIPRPE
jgi:hypothetical protein